MTARAYLGCLVGLVVSAGACSLVNSADDPTPPTGTGGNGGTTTTGGGGSGGAVGCSEDADCADDDNCTIHVCNASNECELSSTTDPDDNNACTEDSCDADGNAVNADLTPTDDDNVCTIDYCDPVQGMQNRFVRPLFEEIFANNDAGWVTEGPWEIGPAVKSGTPVITAFFQIGDPELDNSPTDDNGLAGVVIGGYTPTCAITPMQYLESPEFDGTSPNGENVYLVYARHMTADYENFMAHTVEVRDGSNNWQTIWALRDQNTIADTEWKRVVHDVTMFANPTMKVRFGHAVLQDGVYPDAGSWSIDDVVVGYSNIEVDDIVQVDSIPAGPPSFIGNLCTQTMCDPATGNVTHVPIEKPDDNDDCTLEWGGFSPDDCNPNRGWNTYDQSRVIVHDFSSLRSANLFNCDPLPGQWEMGPAMMGAGDPADDFTDSGDNNILGVNIGGPYNINSTVEEQFSVSLGFLTPQMGTVTVDFKRWLNAGPVSQTPHSIELVRNGVVQQVFFQSGGLAVADNKWVEESYDITPIITSSGAGSFELRFRFQVINPMTMPRGGWNVDDVVVTRSVCQP